MHAQDSNLKIFASELLQHFGAKAPSTSDDAQAAENADYIKRNTINLFEFIPASERLPLTRDANVPPLEPGCSEVQIAIYQPNGVIQVDPEYWSHLSSIDQVALVSHEFVYYLARTYAGAFDSDESRKVIGLIFTGTGTDNTSLVPQSLLTKAHLECKPTVVGTNQPAKEYLNLIVGDEIENGVPGLALYFKQFNSVLAVSRTRAFIPGYSLDRLSKGNVELSTSAFNTSNATTWTVNMQSQGLNMLRIRMSKSDEPQRPFSDIPCSAK